MDDERIRFAFDMDAEDFFIENHEAILKYIDELFNAEDFEGISIGTSIKWNDKDSLYLIFHSPPFKDVVIVDLLKKLKETWYQDEYEKEIYLSQLMALRQAIDDRISSI